MTIENGVRVLAGSIILISLLLTALFILALYGQRHLLA